MDAKWKSRVNGLYAQVAHLTSISLRAGVGESRI